MLFASGGSPVQVELSCLADPSIGALLTRRGCPRDTAETVIGDMAAVPGLVRYLARRDGAPAGGASLRVSEGVAQLCGAATLPEHRRRGVQTALLAARLEVAGREGCDVAVVTTQPGSKSQENAQRRGFELLYTRAALVRALETK